MTEKIRYDLVPDEFMDVALVFMAGIKQGYEPNGWKEGKKFEKEANIASIKRHLRDYRSGLYRDRDSDLHPLLHAACRCLMQYYLDLKQNPNDVENVIIETNTKVLNNIVPTNKSIPESSNNKTWHEVEDCAYCTRAESLKNAYFSKHRLELCESNKKGSKLDDSGCITMEEHLEKIKSKPPTYFKGDK